METLNIKLATGYDMMDNQVYYRKYMTKLLNFYKTYHI